MKLICDICQDAIHIDKFFWLNCGHGLCDECTSKTSLRPQCIACRQRKGSTKPHRLYMQLADPTAEEQARSAAQELEGVVDGSPSSKAKSAGDKLRSLIQTVKLEKDDERFLMSSARALEDRVEPLLHALMMERDEKSALSRRVKELVDKVNARPDVLVQHDLREALNNTTSLLAEARYEAQNFARLHQNEVAQTTRLRNEICALKRKGANDISKLETKLEEKDKQLQLQTRKLRVLANPAKYAHRYAEEDSLVVEL